MYILIDGFTETIHPLESRPLDAILAFCDHVRKYNEQHKALVVATTRAFGQCIVDGTERELFELVEKVSIWVNGYEGRKEGSPHRVFRIRKIPRPACRDCRHWKGHGVYCETGCDEQSALSPGCSEWRPKAVDWVDVDPAHRPTEFYENGLDKRMIAFLANERRAVPTEAIEKHFTEVDPAVVRAATLHLYYNGEIEGVETPEQPGFPTAFRARHRR